MVFLVLTKLSDIKLVVESLNSNRLTFTFIHCVIHSCKKIRVCVIFALPYMNLNIYVHFYNDDIAYKCISPKGFLF